jgi:hypothetical protein
MLRLVVERGDRSNCFSTLPEEFDQESKIMTVRSKIKGMNDSKIDFSRNGMIRSVRCRVEIHNRAECFLGNFGVGSDPN